MFLQECPHTIFNSYNLIKTGLSDIIFFLVDSKSTNVHVVTKYLGLDTWHMQNIQIMQFEIYKANVLEMLVNWSQPKTREEKFILKTKAMF